MPFRGNARPRTASPFSPSLGGNVAFTLSVVLNCSGFPATRIVVASADLRDITIPRWATCGSVSARSTCLPPPTGTETSCNAPDPIRAVAGRECGFQDPHNSYLFSFRLLSVAKRGSSPSSAQPGPPRDCATSVRGRCNDHFPTICGDECPVGGDRFTPAPLGARHSTAMQQICGLIG